MKHNDFQVPTDMPQTVIILDMFHEKVHISIWFLHVNDMELEMKGTHFHYGATALKLSFGELVH